MRKRSGSGLGAVVAALLLASGGAAALLLPSVGAAAPLRVETLRFVDPNPEPSAIVGYRLYVGPDAGHATAIDIGRPAAGAAGIRSYPLLIERDARVTVSLTAVDASGRESARSDLIFRGPRAAAYDHDGDGASDLLRIDTDGGGVEVLRRGDASDPLPLPLAAPAKSAIVARGDFDADGTSDVLWQRKGSRALTLWRLVAADQEVAAADVPVSVDNAGRSGPVAAYAFDEGHGSKTGDASGNGNEGRIGTAEWTDAGRFGGALVFDGAGARVTVADSPSLDLVAGMTLEAWVYPTASSSRWTDIVFKAVDAYYLEGSSPQGGAPAAGGTFSDPPLHGAAALPVGAWSHLASTWDGATLRLYVDGAPVASRPQPGPIEATTGDLTIGGDATFGQHWAGRIDEVRIYDRALDADEIAADMALPIGSPAPVAASSALALTSPPPGPVSGVVTLRAEPADGAADLAVQFLVDGGPLGPEDPAPPYELAWDTRQAGDGLHTLSAAARRAAGSVEVVALPAPGPKLRVVGSGDFDGDLRDDLLLRDVSTGELHLWLIGDALEPQPVVIPGAEPPWRLLGVGDVDADRRSDLVWWDPSTRAIRVWSMDGATLLDDSLLAPALPVGADPIGLGDYDGDGAWDLLVRIPGAHAVAFAPLRQGLGPLAPIAADPGDRTGIAAGYDFDGDGSADLLLADEPARTLRAVRIGAGGGSPAAIDFAAALPPADLARELGDSDNDWSPDRCDADFDGDGIVAIGDLRELLRCIGAPVADECEAMDLDGDGTIGGFDFLSVRSRFGEPPCAELGAP